MSFEDDALRHATAADTRIRSVAPRPATLAPGRETATPIEVLIGRALDDEPHRPSIREVAVGVEAIAGAQVECFPENVFWDFDYLVARLLVTDALAETVERIVDLMHRFGEGTEIRFRYVHDFTYGFDWAKWVRKDPERRAAVGPYDLPFLRDMQRRAGELLELIEADDDKYPRLREERHRNPFAFSREPDAEARLHRALAAEGLIPVEAWRPGATPRWDLDFARLREEHAAS